MARETIRLPVLCKWVSHSLMCDGSIIRGDGFVEGFIKEKYLYWLEAFSFCISMLKGIVLMANLEALDKATLYQLIARKAFIC